MTDGRPVLIFLFCAGLLLACAVPPGEFCDGAPIRLTPDQIDTLTDDQVRAILTHNRRGALECGWRP